MPNQSYPWKRFWVERGELPALDGDYLFDPDNEYAWAYTDKAVPLDSLSDKQVLILLGEAGMGKSQALRDEVEQHQAQTDPAECQIQHLNLNEFGQGDLERLKSTLFDSTQFREYREGACIYIYLDSFDECYALIPHLPQWLVARLKEHITDPKRFFLRVACRTSIWPQHLEEDFKQLWDIETVGVYEICPLRRSDVLAAAEVHELESDKFLEHIEEAEVGSLACRPVTLRLLLALTQQDEGMPIFKNELYELGLQALNEENNPQRSIRKISTSPDQRFAIAGKIAAALFLCNRLALWLGPTSEKPKGDVSIAEITGAETTEIDQWRIDESAVREMLDISGLFSSRGQSRLGFAHQSFGEFLAARYLDRRSHDAKHKLRPLRHTENGDIVVPTRAV